MRLDCYTLGTYTPGAPYWKQLFWYFLGEPLVRSHWLPNSFLKVWILRSFGSKIGQQVRIKPGVRVKFPWRLTVGDYVWIGENAWLDNLAHITLESHVCLSQDVYLCTGNHDWTRPDFQLITAEIYIEQGSWIAARATIGPGVRVGRGSILSLGSVTGRSLQPMTIYAGNPAQPIKKRVIAASKDLDLDFPAANPNLNTENTEMDSPV
ncbi:MAG: WcaF family extracellular polysaccharide biosynthesis acetyltransferase [Aphanothece sp. CMT-3BRIN-NPC111]|jgi:putative colanic acid biosynthesis acetyltransferase WcaF|nr:WcaF family extracellular polysaccharide biosynthesis acetyltransferase [Aphanothece sp. CMT-3BRIN-NPC111]